NLEILEMTKKNYENALEYTRLTANFDGVVAEVNVVENDYFEAGTYAVTIIDRSKLKATVEIDEIDMQYIAIGQKATLTFDSLPGQTLEAYVSYIPMIGRYTTQGIGVVDVELTIDNPPDALIPGFTFSGTISIEGDAMLLLVPSAAVSTTRGGQSTVTVKKDDGTTESRKVNVKYLGEGFCQVISGLEEGEVVTYESSSGFDLMSMMMR
ncbi:MAG: efflux RND transporter periplasmic adaptor subunit, partial [Spirochaetales bacterium]|nr:efflux RND transporter periplasmic adaptor subunit [Candidatus Physcosoma equi]